MKFVYFDESGISAKEKFSIVVGVIIHADKQYRAIEEYITSLKIKSLPDIDPYSILLHAKDIYHGTKLFDRKKMSFESRIDILNEMLKIGPALGLGVCVGAISKEYIKRHINTYGQAWMEHVLSYMLCLRECDRLIGRYSENSEVAMAVCEDNAEVRMHISRVHRMLNYATPSPDLERVSSIVPNLPIKHIVSPVHFVKKDQSPMLQVADHYAFAMNRAFNEAKHHELLIKNFMPIEEINNARAREMAIFAMQYGQLIMTEEASRAS